MHIGSASACLCQLYAYVAPLSPILCLLCAMMSFHNLLGLLQSYLEPVLLWFWSAWMSFHNLLGLLQSYLEPMLLWFGFTWDCCNLSNVLPIFSEPMALWLYQMCLVLWAWQKFQCLLQSYEEPIVCHGQPTAYWRTCAAELFYLHHVRSCAASAAGAQKLNSGL